MFFEKNKNRKLANRAEKILEQNWINLPNGGFTMPAETAFPFQWSSDSAFHITGYLHYDLAKAIHEFRTLYKSQWKNGMLPHIIFHNTGAECAPGPDFWKTKNRTAVSPDHIETSGLTHPPVQAIILWNLYQKIAEKNSEKATDLLSEFYYKVLSQHRYFYHYRDPLKTGLVVIYHPWESGIDNSTHWGKILSKIIPENNENYKRGDIKFVNIQNQISKTEYDRLVHLAASIRDFSYDDNLIQKKHDFLVQDIFVSTLLYISNQKLRKIAQVLKQNTSEIDSWIALFEKNIRNQKYLDKNTGLFCDYDLKNNQILKDKTPANLWPYFSGAFSKEEFSEAIKFINQEKIFDSKNILKNLLPSGDNVSIVVNWLLWKQLSDLGMFKESQKIRRQIINLVNKRGFFENFSSLNHKGRGVTDSSSTAALVIDLINSD